MIWKGRVIHKSGFLKKIFFDQFIGRYIMKSAKLISSFFQVILRKLKAHGVLKTILIVTSHVGQRDYRFPAKVKNAIFVSRLSQDPRQFIDFVSTRL